MKDRLGVAVGVAVFVIMLVLIVFSIRGCTECQAGGGAWITPKDSLPFCLGGTHGVHVR